MPSGWAAVATVCAVVAFALFAVWTVLLSVVDVRERRLPNRLVSLALCTTLPALLASTAALGLDGGAGLVSGDRPAMRVALDTVIAAAACGAGFAVLWRWAPAGIGGGDVKLAPLIGAVTGFAGGGTAALAAVVIVFGVAAVWGAVLQVRRCRGARALRAALPRAALPVSNAPLTAVRLTAVPFAPCLFAAAWVVIVCI
ncbi:prepilin peptidase [Leucobacter sp. USCH14]|uniref:prepilin peptidase n=1 Tax=Leucobacter sp. USCH14 TaxID=3024838 RepID=UPI0030A0FDD4